ncbi:MAG: patatin-like phospholipase family protein [bacterium]
MEYPFINLVFEGGGVKGLAYAGVLKTLEERGVIEGVRRCGGVSAGAIFATLFALGYTAAELEKAVMETDFKKFLDDEKSLSAEALDIARLIGKFGWYSGEYFHNWISVLISRKLGSRKATFCDLASRAKLRDRRNMRELYVCCTNLNTGYGEVYSCENTPGVIIADAVRASMSIPLLFASTHNERRDVMVDGGVVNNYPVKLFDRYKYIDDSDCGSMAVETDYYKQENEDFLKQYPNASPYVYNKQTLGFHLDNPDKIGVYRDSRQERVLEVRNLLEFSRALTRALMNSLGNKHLHSDDWARTVYIDTLGVPVTDFHLNDKQKRGLIDSGRRGAENYFDWFENSDNMPRNCPMRGIK